eukprot:TRINITY_DN804_c0_g1_i10.p1 TRINITY_DN804_c0_g1~~TRINITY_DN804_c0_g1_i10.p1  ORF type:complete len:294 (+),score=87.11 TRINITY_DN804_c0_g1_i10:64-945(+)
MTSATPAQSGALMEAAPQWMHEANDRHEALFAGRQWEGLQEAYHPAGLLIPLCGETFVTGDNVGELFRKEATQNIAGMRFTTRHTYCEAPRVVHELGSLKLTLKSGAAVTTHYYTRWFLTLGHKWVIAFQGLSVGKHEGGKRVQGICSVHDDHCVGWTGFAPPEWMVQKKRSFGELLADERLTELTKSYYHPTALLIPPSGDEFITHDDIWDFLEASTRGRPNPPRLTVTPRKCYFEAASVVHELGTAVDTTNAPWQYYARWVKTDDIHEWEVTLELAWIGDVHVHDKEEEAA